MGRGKGKGNKHSGASSHENTGSGEEEKIHVKRRGRPQKVIKDDIEDEEVEMVGNEEAKINGFVSNNGDNEDNGKKRKKPSQVEEDVDSAKVENGVGVEVTSHQLIKSVGFRQNGSRRKNKPRRAAEVGVECQSS